MLLLMRWESVEGARPGRSRPTQLDKIKNLHTKDTIATENCATRGRSTWMPACNITGTYQPFSDGRNLTIDSTVFEMWMGL